MIVDDIRRTSIPGAVKGLYHVPELVQCANGSRRELVTRMRAKKEIGE
jgi:hypothetical protein